MFEPQDFEIIRCPFCEYQGNGIKPGKSYCQECGLVKGEEAENCAYCGYCGGNLNNRLQ